MSDVITQANATFATKVMGGQQPMFEAGITERVVRLAGTNSDVTTLSMAR